MNLYILQTQRCVWFSEKQHHYVAILPLGWITDTRQTLPAAARVTAATTHCMDAYTDLTVGTRHNITVTVVSQRQVSCDGHRLQRVLVTDHTGHQFPLLVTPAATPLVDLRTGAGHQATGMVVAEPIATPASDEPVCPDCDRPLRPGQVLDTYPQAVTAAVTELDITGPFGLVDTETSLSPLRSKPAKIDDWLPQHDTAAVDHPAYVCDNCEQHVTSHPPADAASSGIIQHMEMGETAGVGNDTVGLAAGGATDVTTFRENIANGYTPQPAAITETGLFGEYYFNIGTPADTEALFAPRYATLTGNHPVTGEQEQYLAVGMDSTLDEAAFSRPRLDLVVVLDVSGSMDSLFDEYYYDDTGSPVQTDADATSKLAAATESLCALTEQLHEDDQLGIVLYNHRAHVAKPLRDVGRTDMQAIRRHIREVAAGGSTNLLDGFEAALDMLCKEPNGPTTEQRIIFMTDMMPTAGATETAELVDRFTDAAAAQIHTTFIGVGVDTNAELANALSGIRGANQYTIRSAAAFRQRLGTEFTYMVTPLAFDVTLEIDADGYTIESIHGTPSADDATDTMLEVTTLFASPKRDGAARGGVILARIDTTASTGALDLTASWADRNGCSHTESVRVKPSWTPAESADPDLRKAVALTRYSQELRRWATTVTDHVTATAGTDDWRSPKPGDTHTRTSVPLVVPEEFRTRFAELDQYLRQEAAALDTDAFQTERALLTTLQNADTASLHAVTESQQ